MRSNLRRIWLCIHKLVRIFELIDDSVSLICIPDGPVSTATNPRTSRNDSDDGRPHATAIPRLRNAKSASSSRIYCGAGWIPGPKRTRSATSDASGAVPGIAGRTGDFSTTSNVHRRAGMPLYLVQ